ncbi:MAG: hypothetical protein EOO03_18160, partial [Chitinophagaceae bacterium]
MKKLFRVCLAVLSAALLLSACNSGSKEGYVLKMRLAKGDSFLNNIKMDMDMGISMMGNTQKMKMLMDMGSKFEVMDSSAAGQQLKMTYTAMQMKMDMGMAAAGVNTDSILNETFKNVIGRSIVVTLKDKKVTNVSGMDSIMIQNPFFSDTTVAATMLKADLSTALPDIAGADD